ncbi:MAG: sigma-54 dependent transcriptional regulator [Gammaproteobacteria bacterium]|nr:sigma-54 dependent transcriptional regulator [Gammaproteobacteria bacterium]
MDDNHPPLSRAAPYILVVDDEPDIRHLVQEILEDEGYEVAVAENGEAARRAHRERRPDLILLDIWMPDLDGITLLKEWSEEGLTLPVIMMSGHGTVETAVEATRLGAYDFIEKPLSLAKLLLTIEHALETDKLQRENLGLRRQTAIIDEPLGRSDVMNNLREQIRRVAQHDSWVLFNGEPGCGTNVAARYLHTLSPRAERPLIEVNVASLSQENSARELFGYESEGKVHYGLLEQANGGSLLLYDIAEMDPDTQLRLHSALAAKSFLRVGGEQPVQLHVRIIATNHGNLEERVTQGQFRKDLFFQLNVVPIEVPPLRAHREDVPELLTYFSNYYIDQQSLPYHHFSLSAQNRLRNYGWPGNTRELINLVQRLLIISAAEEITVKDVDRALGNLQSLAPATTTSNMPINTELPLRDAREQFEKQYLEQLLRSHEGNVSKVAQLAGLERTHLYRKLRTLGIDPKNI